MLTPEEITNRIDKEYPDVPNGFKSSLYDDYFRAPEECKPVYEAWVRGEDWQHVKVRDITAQDIGDNTALYLPDFSQIFMALCEYVKCNLEPHQLYYSYGVR